MTPWLFLSHVIAGAAGAIAARAWKGKSKCATYHCDARAWYLCDSGHCRHHCQLYCKCGVT